MGDNGWDATQATLLVEALATVMGAADKKGARLPEEELKSYYEVITEAQGEGDIASYRATMIDLQKRQLAML